MSHSFYGDNHLNDSISIGRFVCPDHPRLFWVPTTKERTEAVVKACPGCVFGVVPPVTHDKHFNFL